MGSHRCPKCGLEFRTKKTLNVHFQVTKCEENPNSKDSSVEKNDNDLLGDQSKIQDVEGKVVHYDDDGAFGFIQTFDLPSEEDAVKPEQVFFHITDVNEDGIEEGFRLRGDVIKGDRGLKLIEGQVISRETTSGRKSWKRQDEDFKHLGFGKGKADKQTSPGRKPTTSDQDIEDHQDDRKFR